MLSIVAYCLMKQFVLKLVIWDSCMVTYIPINKLDHLDNPLRLDWGFYFMSKLGFWCNRKIHSSHALSPNCWNSISLLVKSKRILSEGNGILYFIVFIYKEWNCRQLYLALARLVSINYSRTIYEEKISWDQQFFRRVRISKFSSFLDRSC